MSDHKLVYSSDGSHQQQPEQAEEAAVDPAQYTLKIRCEKQGRGGKTVTAVFELPPAPKYCQQLCKTLKNKCGSGGTFKHGRIEIQGDKRAQVQKVLEGLGFRTRLAGG